MTDQPTKEQLEAILDTVFECGWEAGERYKEVPHPVFYKDLKERISKLKAKETQL